ncbi:MAG: hypothetical protein GXY83_01555 [Rhodopirellula sp.]|nr:hypothetical protein [Rhodopirellula sp.]
MAQPSSRQIRKVDRSPLSDFDDQLWPINVAIVILGGIAAGVIAASSSFDDPRLFYNGWVRLGGVAVMMMILFWAVIHLQGKMLRRVQLCLIVSLVVHIGLALFLHDRYLNIIASLENEQGQYPSAQREPIAVPDYPWDEIERPDASQSFEEPVEVETPDHRDEIKPEPQPVESPLQPRDLRIEHEPVEQRQPDPAQLRRAEQIMAPRRADALAGPQISRRQTRQRLDDTQPQAQPQVETSETPQASPLSSQSAESPRRADAPAQPDLARQAPAELPPVDPRHSARRVTQPQPDPRSNAEPAAAEKTVRSAELPQAQPDMPQPAAVAKNAPALAPQAQAAATQRHSPSLRETLTSANSPQAAPQAVARAEARAAQPDQLPSQRAPSLAIGRRQSDVAAMPKLVEALPGQTVAIAAPQDTRSPGKSGAVERSSAAALDPGAVAAAGSAQGALAAVTASRPSGARRSVIQESPARPMDSSSAFMARGNSPSLDAPAAMPIELPVTSGADVAGEASTAMAGSEIQHEADPSVASIGRSPAEIAARALAGGSDTVAGIGSEGVVAAAWRDSPRRSDDSPLAASAGSGGGLARAIGPLIAGESLEELADAASTSATRPGNTSPSLDGGSVAESSVAAVERRGTPLAAGALGPVDGSSAGLAAAVPGTGAVARRSAPGNAASQPRAAEIGGGSIRRSAALGSLPAGPLMLDEPRTTSLAGSPAPAAGTAALSGSPGAEGDVARRQGALPIEIAANTGPGGLRYDPAAMIGIPNRRARPESDLVHPIARRFVVQRSGGELSMEGRLREMSKEAFRQRDPGTRGQTARTRGGSESTERAVEMGLDFLARHQFPPGHWSLDRLPAGDGGRSNWGVGQMNADTAGTGLGLLAFLGAGYTHREEKYRTVVRSGLDWLLSNQQDDGRLFTEKTDQTLFGRMYGHGIATIALCEAYGMTKDPELRQPAQRAVEFILSAQHPTQGGWRYEPRLESDTSVSGWQLMALRSAQMAGLAVPAENLHLVGRWLDQAQATGGARYRYNPYATDTPEQRHGRTPNRTMTAEGLLMRMYLGWERDNPSLIEGAEYLKGNLPEVGTQNQPLRDSYYWYYATQVMFHMQGEFWSGWNDRLRPLLESSQVSKGDLAGSWNPDAPIADRWSQAAGRLYVTTLNLLMLEVYYRHLPLYQTLSE